jgi:hypothetical protein
MLHLLCTPPPVQQEDASGCRPAALPSPTRLSPSPFSRVNVIPPPSTAAPYIIIRPRAVSASAPPLTLPPTPPPRHQDTQIHCQTPARCRRGSHIAPSQAPPGQAVPLSPAIYYLRLRLRLHISTANPLKDQRSKHSKHTFGPGRTRTRTPPTALSPSATERSALFPWPAPRTVGWCSHGSRALIGCCLNLSASNSPSSPTSTADPPFLPPARRSLALFPFVQGSLSLSCLPVAVAWGTGSPVSTSRRHH